MSKLKFVLSIVFVPMLAFADGPSQGKSSETRQRRLAKSAESVQKQLSARGGVLLECQIEGGYRIDVHVTTRGVELDCVPYVYAIDGARFEAKGAQTTIPAKALADHGFSLLEQKDAGVKSNWWLLTGERHAQLVDTAAADPAKAIVSEAEILKTVTAFLDSMRKQLAAQKAAEAAELHRQNMKRVAEMLQKAAKPGF